MSEYTQQAIDFANKYGITLKVIGEPEYRKYFNSDDHCRYVFKLELSRNKKSYTFTFGQSIAAGNRTPDMYTVLACLTKSDPEYFEDFCDSYGYPPDSTHSKKVYKSVLKEWNAVNKLFGDILDELCEIN